MRSCSRTNDVQPFLEEPLISGFQSFRRIPESGGKIGNCLPVFRFRSKLPGYNESDIIRSADGFSSLYLRFCAISTSFGAAFVRWSQGERGHQRGLEGFDRYHLNSRSAWNTLIPTFLCRLKLGLKVSAPCRRCRPQVVVKKPSGGTLSGVRVDPSSDQPRPSRHCSI